MAKKYYDNENAPVHVYERTSKATGKVTFYLHYTLGGEQVRERLMGEDGRPIPPVEEGSQDYKDKQAFAKKVAFERMSEIRSGQLGFSNRYAKLLLHDWMEHCAEQAERNSKEAGDRHTWARMLRQTADIVDEFAAKKYSNRYDNEKRKVRVVEVDKDFVKDFIDWLQHDYTIRRYSTRGGIQHEGMHLSPKSAHKKFSCLRFALNEAVRDDVIAKNPCNQLERTERIKVNESTREYLTEEELQRLTATPTEAEGMRRAYLFMCCCGLRISDVKRLTWADLERRGDRTIIRIRQQKTKDPIYLPLSEQACKYLPERGDGDAGTLIFGDLPTEPAMNRTLKAWAKRAGITKNLTLHTGRHTLATMLISKGADLYTVSKLLGHTDVKTTQIYAKIIDKKREDAVDLLNNLF